MTRIRLTQLLHSIESDHLTHVFDRFASGRTSSLPKTELKDSLTDLDVAIIEFEKFENDPVVDARLSVSEMASVLRFMVSFFCLSLLFLLIFDA
jgi:hypothetical protein